jgi:hypothetical protein
MAAVTPVLVAGMVSRTYIHMSPELTGTFVDFASVSGGGAPRLLSSSLALLILYSGIYGLGLALFLPLWSHKVVVPVFLKVVVPSFVLMMFVTLYNMHLVYSTGEGLPSGTTLPSLVINFTCYVIFSILIGQRLGGLSGKILLFVILILLPNNFIMGVYGLMVAAPA